MPFDDETLQQFLRLLGDRQEARSELRRLLGDDGVEQALRDLARAQARTDERLASLTEQVGQLAQAQARTEQRLASLTERVDRLAEAQARTEQRMDQFAQRMDQLAEAQARTDERLASLSEQVGQLTIEVRELVTWQKGEAGRRNGERYEQQVRRRAPGLFQGGSGGSPIEPRVQDRLEYILADLLAQETPDERRDPSLADVIWWKDGSFAVVEAALFVEWDDIERAYARAETLRRAGADKGIGEVLPVVFGRAWSSPEVRDEAKRLGLAWWVGDDLAPSLLEYRRLRPSPR